MKKSDNNKSEYVNIHPSLETGEIIENRYKVIQYKKIIIDGTLCSGGRGYCSDLHDNEKM